VFFVEMGRFREKKNGALPALQGGIYELVCEATLESDPTVTMIVYKAANGTIWTRPASVFFEMVEVDGAKVPRFAPIN
jgi:Uncharacterized protein conserved in bacteria